MRLPAAALLLVATLTAHAAERAADFGRQWVRAQPFTLMALCHNGHEYDVRQYAKAGFTSMLAWKTRPGILRPASEQGLPWFGHIYAKQSAGSPDAATLVRDLAARYRGNAGWIVNDEPPLDQMEATGKALDALRRVDPQKVAMSNLGSAPDFGRHVRDFVRLVRPDVLMYDTYPFGPEAPGFLEPEVYFGRMAIVREEALKARVPYWAWVQSNMRDLSESDLRVQLFAYLAHGYSGLAYFMYDYWHLKRRPGLVDEDGAATVVYGYASRANRELLHLGTVTKNLTSTHVFVTPHAAAARPVVPPRAIPAWRPGALARDPLKSIAILEPGAEKQGLLGYFEDDAGDRYVMLTNLFRKRGRNEGSAQATRVSFRLAFAPEVKAVHRISRETGQAEPLALDVQHTAVVTLPGGTGDLLRISTR